MVNETEANGDLVGRSEGTEKKQSKHRLRVVCTPDWMSMSIYAEGSDRRE
jgi:hypothetical protein